MVALKVVHLEQMGSTSVVWKGY
jgi:hypothetical protein